MFRSKSSSLAPARPFWSKVSSLSASRCLHRVSAARAAYHKHAIRGDTDISIVCIGVRIGLDADGTVNKARVALGAVAPTPIRVHAVEELLAGKKLTDDIIERAARLAEQSIAPISDQRASAEYRKEMVYVNMKNMIREAAAKIG